MINQTIKVNGVEHEITKLIAKGKPIQSGFEDLIKQWLILR